VDLKGAEVRLRPFERAEVAIVARARPGVDRRRLRRRLAYSGRFHDGRLDLAIEAGGELVGEVDVRNVAGAMPEGVYELGIEVFRESRRGRGYGTDAVTVLVDYLFRGVGAARIQASTALENTAMRRVLEKTGFAYEGTMRAFMPSGGGRRHDFALYAITRGDWEGR
jgi:RimJ/RimL family protein N-acetyltransferase